MQLGKEVDLGPGHTALDGDPAPPPHSSSSSLFGPCLLWPDGRPSQQLLSSCFQFLVGLGVGLSVSESSGRPHNAHRTIATRSAL